jgi:hypothetical protein
VDIDGPQSASLCGATIIVQASRREHHNDNVPAANAERAAKVSGDESYSAI